MALELSLSYSQSNDAKSIVFTDSTGDYDAVDNTGGWGFPNEAYEDIVDSETASNYHLLLIATVTDKTGTSITYDAINLYDVAETTPFTETGDLTWTFNASDFVVGDNAMGTSEDELTDGIWDITYKLTDASDSDSTVAILSQKILVDGSVRLVVYNKLREVPKDYDCEYYQRSQEIMEALLAYTYLSAIDASATISEESDLITMLYSLDKICTDGSKYTW